MKKQLLLVSALLFGALLSLQAQAPQAIQYQTIIRNAAGEVVMNQNVGLQLTVRQTTATGTAVYQETHTKMTNDYGLVNLQIGTGTPVSGTLAGVDWSMGPYYLEVGLDLTGGSSYTVMGTTQLLSVPYALYAETANVPGVPGPPGADGADGAPGADGADGADGTDGADGADGNTVLNGTVNPTNEGADGDFYINTTTKEIFGPKAMGTWPTPGTSLVGPAASAPTYDIGDKALGGTVFYVNSDGTHGLVAANKDQYEGVNWYNAHDGLNDPGKHDNAGNKYFDWRLPTKWELNEMYDKRFDIGGFDNLNYYWSSTEGGSNDAWSLNFFNGSQHNDPKGSDTRVRAVRAF